jgi:hypothetical protein
MKYIIKYGLGGGFGGASDEEVLEFDNYDQAIDFAWEKACEIYDQYDGLHGLRTVHDIMEEDGLDEGEAYETWKEERESWLEYSAEEVKE